MWNEFRCRIKELGVQVRRVCVAAAHFTGRRCQTIRAGFHTHPLCSPASSLPAPQNAYFPLFMTEDAPHSILCSYVYPPARTERLLPAVHHRGRADDGEGARGGLCPRGGHACFPALFVVVQQKAAHSAHDPARSGMAWRAWPASINRTGCTSCADGDQASTSKVLN